MGHVRSHGSAENSGDLTEIVRDCVSGHGLSYAVSFVHVETTRSPDNPRMLPELDLISRALQHAPLASLDDDARIWKATRRHIIGNIHPIVVKATNDVDCRFHIRNYLRACLAGRRVSRRYSRSHRQPHPEVTGDRRSLRAAASKEGARDHGDFWSPPSRLLSVAPQDEVVCRIRSGASIKQALEHRAGLFVAGFNKKEFEEIVRTNMRLFVPREPTGENSRIEGVRGKVGHVARSALNVVAPSL